MLLKNTWGTSLVAQWLRIHLAMRDVGSIPGRGTWSLSSWSLCPVEQLSLCAATRVHVPKRKIPREAAKISSAAAKTWCSQIIKKKKNRYIWNLGKWSTFVWAVVLSSQGTLSIVGIAEVVTKWIITAPGQSFIGIFQWEPTTWSLDDGCTSVLFMMLLHYTFIFWAPLCVLL